MNPFRPLLSAARKIVNSTLSRPASWLIEALGGGKSASGEIVTQREAMGLSAYLACIKNISEDIGKMPLAPYERLNPRGRKQLYDHKAFRLVHDEPNPEMSAMSFRETITAHALAYHGGFAEIVRDGAGNPAALWPLDPTTVSVRRTIEKPRRLYYLVSGNGLPSVPIEPEDMLVIHGLGFDALTGYVLTCIAKDTLGNAIAAQKFTGSYYANGTTTTGVIKVPNAMTEAAFKNLRTSFAERHTGAGNQNRPIILEQGAEWQATSNKPQDSQMIETLQQGVEEVARLFRMPPHKIGHLLRSTNNNIEQQALEYVQDTLMSWFVRWEQECNRKLLKPSERSSRFFKHNVTAMLRGDMAARSTFYREGFNIGYLSPNDIRELEDQNPIEGGDTYFVNATMVPLEMAAKGEHLAAKADPKEPRPNDNTPPDERDNPKAPEDRSRIALAHQPLIEDAIGSLLRVEHDKAARAEKKGQLATWAADFYSESHEKHVLDRLNPSLTALAESLGGERQYHRDFAKSWATQHVERSAREAQSPSDRATWTNGARARAVAEGMVAEFLELTPARK